jgi:hypothetical protein
MAIGAATLGSGTSLAFHLERTFATPQSAAPSDCVRQIAMT